MARRTERFTVRQLAEELVSRLEADVAEIDSHNLKVALLKAKDVVLYLSRWEDPRNPERLDNGELTK